AHCLVRLCLRPLPTPTLSPYTTLFRSTGATAVRVALLSIAAGETDTALAVGVEKMGKMGLLGSAAKKRDAKKEYAPKGRYAFGLDRKSTRLNSSHVKISYAVFCLKKKN